jgi:hypothetical protein
MIVTKKPVINVEPSQAQGDQHMHFKMVAFSKFAQNNPELRPIY